MLGGRDEPRSHCSSQIGMTKIMEIYKARNIYSRSYGLFREGLRSEGACVNSFIGCENRLFCDCAVLEGPRRSAGPKWVR